MNISYGYMYIDPSVIPPIQSKTRVTCSRALCSHIYIDATQPITISLMNHTRTHTFVSGRYFIWNPSRERNAFSIDTDEQISRGQVYDNCAVNTPYNTVLKHPFIQLGNIGIYYYYGTIVGTSSVWVGQIEHPLHDIGCVQYHTQYIKTIIPHTQAYCIKSNDALIELGCVFDIFPSADCVYLCITYPKYNRRKIQIVLQKYDINLDHYTQDIPRTVLSFKDAQERATQWNRTKRTSGQLSGIQYIEQGISHVSEDIYERFCAYA